jgi:dGTPase
MTAQAPSPRELYEAHQKAWLRPGAVTEADSLGRRHHEGSHPYRTCFQRDRDRIVHCSAFRRLDFKTQVFVPHEHDHFRTRMTHTLEVAQIGRCLGRALRLNEDLIEAVALAHDLGHPPFGHGGEAVLEDLMAEHGHFEHNRQSLRVVDYLEHPYVGFRGLNLTGAVRECLAKHRTRYDSPACDEFDPSRQPPLEGQLADLADEIAYTSADLEDALAAEIITENDLEGLAIWRQAVRQAREEAPHAGEVQRRIRACKAVLATMADDLLATSAADVESLQPRCVDDVRDAGRPYIRLSKELAPEVRRLQDFLLTNVYLRGANAEKDCQARKVISELFSAYVADLRLLPQRYRGRMDRDGLHRVACDYIAGMTDRFCLQQHQAVCGG